MTGFIRFAYALGADGSRALAEDEIIDCLRAETLGWLHLDASEPGASTWISEHLPFLDPHAQAALLHPATRPRVTEIDHGLLAVFRGVNLNEGADPEDMVSVRCYAHKERIVTVSLRRVRALEDIAAACEAGQGPTSPGAFLALLADNLTGRIEQFTGALMEQLDTLEEAVLSEANPELRQQIINMRMRSVIFHRYVVPQRDAVSDFLSLDKHLLDKHSRRQAEETRQRLARVAEDLVALRENCAILREEIAAQMSDRLNRNMYILSVVTVVFLPLGFLTGLFGINIGGMPGVNSPMAFWIFCGVLLALLVACLALFRRLRWL